MNYIAPDLSKQNSFALIRLVCCLLVIYEIRKNYEMEK